MENGRKSLERSLTITPLVLFGLAYMAPMIVFGTYGVIAEATNGLVPTAYLIALIAMLFTAYSYGKMVQAYPVSGSAYTYTRKSINPHLGFLVGWAVLLDYLFLPMVIWLIGSVYLHAAFPSVSNWIWIAGFIVVTTIINFVGLRVSSRVNFLMMLFQFLVIFLFIILSIICLMNGKGTGTFLSSAGFFNSHASFSLALTGASIACYSFLGFDAVTTLSEETINPKKTIPRAIFFVALIGGGVFVITSYFIYLVYPDFHHFKNIDSAGFEIAKFIGGNLFSAIFLAGMITAQFASGLSAQASASRLLFAMGRDSVLPKKVFGFLHKRYHTPIFNLLTVAVIALLALKMDVASSTSFINFGAFVTFTFVNLSVIGHYFVKKGMRSGKNIIFYLLLPLIGAFFDLWLLINLDKNALILGVIWAAIGFVYLLYLTKMFRKSPPELSINDVDAAS
ncbi:amino acid/polyamine/organocation transporter (APC superfamily) [Scopulibacillus darangshiensis]|uniref:Amino acid/polyamine/organocation transporter (APC superfamily) n=1 Tax=Scopulibacillus darangshiensis TaxID=442528 RepID=A0A4V2SN26_9BACL|nr:APC family permease [Scopulibacillus darangshiensis]TCP29626.1 amino acid/polyamine/organocation transporter (APC superfamily) [Scopulibacillus darangshiensis]